MRVKNTLIRLFVAIALLVPFGAAAQTSSINAFSPFTMYGIGELNTPGTLPMRSMGGVGVAVRSGGVVNLLNPAAFSAAPQKTFLFDFGLEGQNYYNAQRVSGEAKKTAYNTFNFHDIAFQFPLAKKLGLGFSLTPYSSVGYRIRGDRPYDPSDPVWGNVGRMHSLYEGEGDITEVKVGIGWELFKNFSVGIAAQYYWGSLDRTFTMEVTPITGDGNYVAMKGMDKYVVSSIKGQVGVQWDAVKNTKRVLTVGAAFDFGGDLHPEVTKKIYVNDLVGTVAKNDETHLPLLLPRQLQAGLFYQTAKWSLGADYVYQDWGGRNARVEHTAVSGPDKSSFAVAYTDTHTLKFGAEFTPDRYDIRHFLKRWSYRAGFRCGAYNQTFGGHRLAQYAVTLGIGIPVKQWAVSGIDIGVEYGRRGYNVAERIGLVRQQYVKFSIGFTLFAGAENSEYWFLRPKYD